MIGDREWYDANGYCWACRGTGKVMCGEARITCPSCDGYQRVKAPAAHDPNNDPHAIAQWMEANHRVKWQARNEKGRAALIGEFMVLAHNRKPILRAYVEAFVAELNRDWARGTR